MNIFIKRTFILLFVVTQGCATYGKISGIPSVGQKSLFKDGREVLISVEKSTVAIAPEMKIVKNGRRGNFIVAINNGTNQEIIFSTNDVTAYFKTNDEITSLKVFSYEELIAEEKKRQAWAAVGAALQGAADSINAANAGYSRTYGTYSGSTYSGGIGLYSYGTYSGSTYNYAASQAARNAAQANSAARFARLETEGQKNLSNLAAKILKKETIFPGAWHGGIVKMELPPVSEIQQEIELIVNINGEKHKFRFTQEKIDNK